MLFAAMLNLRLIKTILFGIGHFVVACLILLSLPGWADSKSELRIETAFIYQFTNYISWPSGRDPGSINEPFVISVVGNSLIIPVLQELSRTKTVKGRKIEVLTRIDGEPLQTSHMIILDTSDEELLRKITRQARGSGALIISSTKGFASKGAMINFFQDDGRLRFEINRSALEGEKLVASSQLLKLARLVE